MAADFDFSGKTALITGAASGIGAATARWLDAHGITKLVLVDMNRPALDALDLDCEVRRIGGDVSDSALWKIGMAEVTDLDCVLLNAGISDAFPIVDGDLARWRKLMAVNLDGVFLGLRHALKVMRSKGGTIAVTASAAAFKAEPGTAAYAAAKAAVVQLARVAAREGAEHGIRVNAIAPGGVDTPIWDGMDFFADMTKSLGSREAAIASMGEIATPLGRYATADEIAAQIGFLLSDLSANITGAVLRSDGGYTL
ncbi:SDR family NAD(P)-dependent oxidoreductase [Croceicoccus naphthovorans]|uniref:Oxidoreductase n=1 Tax=Croceicoccus naphthovorans TaxID=1348774 RepID=A0A0G3XHU9_9SPHN|nr:SDR family oxidoreductase [Croceicoccus naphthovorans]AKM10179.1 oxidoreductase [Croceicoccus naphthovorans]MBB3990585.1 NAD(P)-dependent dehydrogenase (short-subunit alcohol dehydrogenase family) [Croceicoccus naphthovorans]